MNDHTHLNDHDLQALAGEIDRLAFSDRGPAGIEERVYNATLPVLQSAKGAQPTLRIAGTPAVRRTAVLARTHTSIRIAAGFALLATGVMTWMAARPGTPATTHIATASIADDWAILSSVLDDQSSRELEDILSATSTLDDSINSIGSGDQIEEGVM